MFVAIEPQQDGFANMARDAELLQQAENAGSCARVYSWDGPWVSLGRFQVPERALLDTRNTQWVMRPTGGKAVLHGHDVTVGLAANLVEVGIDPRNVAEVYRTVIGALVEALNQSGMPVVLAETTAHVRQAGHTADCFAHTSPNDVVDPETGEKVCGCALRITERAVLLQASIPICPPLVDPATVFATPHVPSRARELSLERLAEALRTIPIGQCVQSMV